MKWKYEDIELGVVLVVSVSVFIYCNVRMIIEQVWNW